jgi:hypothetical protein
MRNQQIIKAQDAIVALQGFIASVPRDYGMAPTTYIVYGCNAFFVSPGDPQNTLQAAPQCNHGGFEWDNAVEVDSSSIETRQDAEKIEQICKFLRASWPSGFQGSHSSSYDERESIADIFAPIPGAPLLRNPNR